MYLNAIHVILLNIIHSCDARRCSEFQSKFLVFCSETLNSEQNSEYRSPQGLEWSVTGVRRGLPQERGWSSTCRHATMNTATLAQSVTRLLCVN